MEKKLKRTIGKEALFLGICGGLAKFLAIDVSLVRILWAVLTFFGFGSPIIIYLIMALVVPKEDAPTPEA